MSREFGNTYFAISHNAWVRRQDRYLAVVLSDAVGEPAEELDGQTPLRAAPMPHLDALSAASEVGLAYLPEHVDASRPETVTCALLGVEPPSIPHGPLLAAAIGLGPGDRDVCFRCEFVSTDGDTLFGPTGPLPEAQAHTLLRLIEEKLSTRRLRVIPTSSSVKLLVWAEGPRDLECLAPMDVAGAPLRQALPRGDHEEVLRRFLDDCLNLLHDHPINRARLAEGLPPANLLWPYEHGTTPHLRPFTYQWGMTGGLVSSVPELRGLAKLLGMSVPTNELSGTDYDALLALSLDLLDSHVFVFLHVAACSSAAHRGDPTEVAYILRDLDARLVGPIRDAHSSRGFRLLLLCSGKDSPGASMPYLLTPGAPAANPPPFDERLTMEEDIPKVSAQGLVERLVRSR